MSVVHFLLSRQVPASHPEQVSALPGGPAAAKDMPAVKTELTPRCQHTHAYKVIGRMEKNPFTSSMES